MLYKFKSKATGDLIMLEQHGSQLLRIIGKEPAAQGILLCADMPAALQAITQTIAQHEARARENASQQGQEDSSEPAELITLRQRAVPFMDMLRRCMAQTCDVVWGV
jgi:cyclopropane-fatty-acyl-phospholipid synthase